MTTDATENHDAARRDGSGLGRGVRPAAWKRKGGDLRGVSYFPMENGDEPLYDQAALDAAVSAERERIKARLLGMDDAAAGRHNYYAHAAWVLFDRKA